MPTGTYLEGQFDLSFELNNQVFSTSDAASLPGSFTFPADVPLTDANKVALGHPHLVTNAKNWQVYEGVWVECYGVPMFYGTLKIIACDQSKVRTTIASNPIKKIKDTLLSELDLGGERDFFDTDSLKKALMKSTGLTPEFYDFIFFPVHSLDNNAYLFDFDDPLNQFRAWWNYYDDTVTETYSFDSAAIVPFVKISYLLEQIFSSSEFTFVNKWQGSTEMQRLYLFNNTDLRISENGEAPFVPDVFNLSNHVPKIKAVELLKKLVAQWALGLFTNVFNKTVSIVPLEQVLSRAPAADWSAYAIGFESLESSERPPTIFNYEQSITIPAEVPSVNEMEVIFTSAEFADALPSLADGYYYIETDYAIVQVVDNAVVRGWNVHKGVTFDSAGPQIDIGISGLLQIINVGEVYNSPVVASRFYEKTDTEGDTVYEWGETDPPVALMFFRGFQELNGGNPFPVACNHVWNPYSSPAALLDITTSLSAEGSPARSLNWFGEYGLYETAHKTWTSLLYYGKHISQQFALPVSALVAFSFEDKIRVGSMDYFVKRLRIGKPLGGGKVLVEASMVSVI